MQYIYFTHRSKTKKFTWILQSPTLHTGHEQEHSENGDEKHLQMHGELWAQLTS